MVQHAYQCSAADHVFDDMCNKDSRKKRETDDFETIFGDLAEEEDYTELE